MRRPSKTLGIVIGFGYDNSQLKEQRHPTRDDLDAVSNDIRSSSCTSPAIWASSNSKGLEILGYTKRHAQSRRRRHPATRGRQGAERRARGNGAVRRAAARSWAGSDPTASRPGQGGRGALDALRLHDGRRRARSIPPIAKAMRAVAAEGGFKVDVVTYPTFWSIASSSKSNAEPRLQEPLPDRRRQADDRRLAAGLHGLARPALLQARRRLSARLRRAMRGDHRTDGRRNRLGLCQRHPDPHPCQRRGGDRPADRRRSRRPGEARPAPTGARS